MCIRMLRTTKPAVQDFSSHRAIAEPHLPFPDMLKLFVAPAGKQHRISRLRQFHGKLYGITTFRDRKEGLANDASSGSRSHHDLLDDPIWIFTTRIFGGHDSNICLSHRNATEDGPVLCLSLAGMTEDNNDLTPGEGTTCLQCSPKPLRRMPIIHKYRERLSFVDCLHPASHTPDMLRCTENVFSSCAEPHAGGNGGKPVRHIEMSEKVRLHPKALGGSGHN